MKMKKIIVTAGFMMACASAAHAGVFGDRLAIGIANNIGARKWDIDQQATLKASPFTTTKSAYPAEFKTLGFGILAAIETTQPGFSITPTAALTFDGTSEATAGGVKIDKLEQFNMTVLGTFDLAYKVGFIAPFVSPGVGFTAMGEMLIDGKTAAPNLSYTSVGLFIGGGIKVYFGDKLYARASYNHQVTELFGSRGQPEDSAATSTYVLSRTFTSGSNISLSVNYIFGSSDTDEKKAIEATPVVPATAVETKPVETKPVPAKKKNR